jgi:hypothetical protein
MCRPVAGVIVGRMSAGVKRSPATQAAGWAFLNSLPGTCAGIIAGIAQTSCSVRRAHCRRDARIARMDCVARFALGDVYPIDET